MSWWEILLIIRGYDWRNVLQYQLQRLQAFCAMFAFSGNKKNLEIENTKWRARFFYGIRL